MRYFISLILTGVVLVSCQDQESLLRIQELETQLDECQNGADKLAAMLEADFKEEKDSSVFELYQKIKSTHPEYPRITELEKMAIESSKRIMDKEKARLRKIEEEKEARLSAVNKLKKNTDDVSGNTFYQTKRFTHYNNENLVSLYIGFKTSAWLRMKASYYGDDWIFFDKMYLSYDGNTREIIFNQYQDKDSDNGSGNVWEWVDIAVDKALIDYLGAFLDSENAKIRFQGKYTNTRTLSKKEKTAMKEVLLAFDVLTNGSI